MLPRHPDCPCHTTTYFNCFFNISFLPSSMVPLDLCLVIWLVVKMLVPLNTVLSLANPAGFEEIQKIIIGHKRASAFVWDIWDVIKLIVYTNKVKGSISEGHLLIWRQLWRQLILEKSNPVHCILGQWSGEKDPHLFFFLFVLFCFVLSCICLAVSCRGPIFWCSALYFEGVSKILWKWTEHFESSTAVSKDLCNFLTILQVFHSQDSRRIQLRINFLTFLHINSLIHTYDIKAWVWFQDLKLPFNL